MRFTLLFFIIVSPVFAQKTDFKTISFKKADSIVTHYSNEELNNLPKLAYNLTHGLDTDAERFRAIYKWVSTNVSNNYSLFLKNKRKRYRFRNDSVKLQQWNTRFNKIIFKQLRNKRTTICTGYAYLIKTLSNLVDIECEIVQGYGRTSMTNIDLLNEPNHSWNAVKLNGKWYLCDATWASGIPNPETNKFTFNYNDGFFLADQELFAINHYPENRKWLLSAPDTSFEAFLENPIIYGKAYTHLVTHKLPLKMHQTLRKNQVVNFKYQLQNSIEKGKIKLLIDNGFNSKTITPTALVLQNNTLTLAHSFKAKGFYDVHLYFGTDLIATYTFRVNSLRTKSQNVKSKKLKL